MSWKVRDFEKDLEICESATPGPRSIASTTDGKYVLDCNDWVVGSIIEHFEDARFITEARTGWPETIRYAMKLEEEIDRLREENAMLLEQLNQRGCRV